MAENQVYLIKSGQNSFVEETEAIVGISGGKVGIGTTAPEADLHVTGSVKIGGDLAVDGTFTTINSSTISVDDKNIELGSTDSPTDITADGGGITVKGATDKTFNWIDATDAWTSSEHLHLAAGKRFAADGIRALGASGLNIGDDAGNGIFVQDGGKVGIATTNPGYDLDVDGSGNFASLYVDGNAVLTGEGSIFGKWEDGAAQGEIFYTGGNVGVGTNNPEYPLHVVGNSVVDGNFVVNGTSGNFNVSDFNVSGDSIVLNYGGGSLTSNRGGIIVKDSSFANKTFEYVEGSDYWNSNVGLNITNGGINAASVSAVDANGLTLGDDAGNGIFVEDGGQIGINTTSPGYNLHVNGSTHVGGEFSVGNEFKISAGGAVGGTAPASDGDIIKWDDTNNKWVAGANVGGGGGGGVGEVPLATINSLPSGQSIYEIEFAETYNVEPRIATQLEIDGEGSIIPYVVSGVSTSGYHLIFAQDIPNNNYRIHTTFGGRDVHWETGAGASLYYNDGDVNIQRNFTIGGNLTVNGTTTTVNTETVEIEDHNLVIAANTGYNQLTNEYPGAGGAYAGILWGTGDAGAASPVSLTYQTNKGFAFEGGNVGIGTTSPAKKLHIHEGTASTAAQIHFTNASTGGTNNDGATLMLQSSNLLFRNRETDGAIGFQMQDGSIEALRIAANGNVGIGTSTVDSALHIKKTTPRVTLQIAENSGYNTIESGAGNQLIFGRSGTEQMRIDSNGNVGIGTTNPGVKLSINLPADLGIPDLGIVGGSIIDTISGARGLVAGHASGGDYFLQVQRIDNAPTAYDLLLQPNGGNVGIGTTNPSAKLHIEVPYTDSADIRSGQGRPGAVLRLTHDAEWHTAYESGGSDPDFLGGIEFESTDSNAGTGVRTAIKTTVDSSLNSNSLVFYTAPESTPGIVERMRIDSAGNVGIGTTNPAAQLDISKGGGAGVAKMVLTGGDGEVTESKLEIFASGLAADSNERSCINAISDGSSRLAFQINSVERMRIENSGNVGIGTTNPGERLHIEGASPSIKIKATNQSGLAEIKLQSDAGDNNADLWSIRASNNQPADNHLLEFMSYSTGSFASALAIDSNGNVGIGTTNPGALLHVAPRNNIDANGDPTNESFFKVFNNATSGTAQGRNGGVIYIDANYYSQASTIFAVNGRGDNKFTIQGSGNVGIGTANPIYAKLQVHGDSAATRVGLLISDASGRTSAVHQVGDNLLFDDFTSGSTRMVINGSNGNVGIGTSNPGDNKLRIYDSDAGTAGTSASPQWSDSLFLMRNIPNNYQGTRILFAHGKAAIGGFREDNSEDGSHHLSFFTGSNPQAGMSERMRIKHNGNVGIGNTNPSAPLHISSDNAAGGYNLRVSAGGGGSEDRGMYIAAGKTSPTSAGHCVYIAFHDGDGTAAGGIRNSSTVSNPEFFNGSDVRMKKNIEDCDINGIQKIKSLRLRKWDWNTEKAITPTDIGLVADELEQVFPELVSRQKLDGWEHCVAEGEELLKTIPSESKITLTLLKAIQEQQQMIEDLKSQNASLESRISALES
jgi:hypothetical protein